MIAETTTILDKTRELCEAIVGDSEFRQMQGDIERFLLDEPSKLQYQSVHEQGEALHHKQQAGVELSRTEIQNFESARDALFENETVRDFMAAQQGIEQLQKEIRAQIGLTVELGRVPNEEELAQATAGGCCGGGGGGGCGCA